jgi:hypothetical protein
MAALLFAKVVSAEAGGVCGAYNTSPGPFPKGRGEPSLECFTFKKLGPVDLAFVTPKNREKGIPLPFGKGLGDGL